MHAFGHPCDLDGLATVCERFDLPLVEDAAESLGSTYRDRHTGTVGRLGALSFNGNKTVTTGGGGAVLTDDARLAARVRHLATTARTPHPWRFDHDAVGYNYRLPSINAALGCAQLEQLPGFLARKRALSRAYGRALAPIDGVAVLAEPDHGRSNFWLNALVAGPGGRGPEGRHSRRHQPHRARHPARLDAPAPAAHVRRLPAHGARRHRRPVPAPGLSAQQRPPGRRPARGPPWLSGPSAWSPAAGPSTASCPGSWRRSGGTPGLALRVAVTGSHLEPRFGDTWREIDADGFPIDVRIPLGLDRDTPEAVAAALGPGHGRARFGLHDPAPGRRRGSGRPVRGAGRRPGRLAGPRSPWPTYTAAS